MINLNIGNRILVLDEITSETELKLIIPHLKLKYDDGIERCYEFNNGSTEFQFYYDVKPNYLRNVEIIIR